jgi:prepilin-type N-terminal cleavage/methylation domain-containing protein
MQFRRFRARGFTLIETLVGVAVFSTIALTAWAGFVNIFEAMQILRVKTTATNLATEQIEIIRNLPYDDVGVVNSIPNGVVPHKQTLERDGRQFEVTTIIRNVDHAFDGTIGGTPNDTSPADNKLVAITIECFECAKPIEPITIHSYIAPRALESAGNNGAIFVEVFDANGQPVQGADIHIEYVGTTTPIIIDDVTNDAGLYQLVDAPPGIASYWITVSKEGYSTERTYALGDPVNPVPDKLHANVAAGQVTEISFSIDEVSRLNVYSRTVTCAPVPSVDFNLAGSKTIGTNTLKYDEDARTDTSGWVQLNDIEWDTYVYTVLEAGLDLIGANPNVPFDVSPGTTQSIDLMFANADPNAVLITVTDGSNEQLLSDATVTLTQGATVISTLTGIGHLSQTDWSGGSGQSEYTNVSQYSTQNGDIETSSPVGELKLASFSGAYAGNGWLESSTFDIGTTTNFLTLNWNPGDQPALTGDDAVRFQVATNETLDEPVAWNFIGPGGSSDSYYTTSGQSLSSNHDGDRYLRYKVYLETENTTATPNVSDIRFSFATDCTPVGQAYISGLNNSPYTVTITKTGYTPVTLNGVLFNQDWQAVQVTLNPL